MAIHDVVFRAESDAGRLDRPNCPHCGELLLLPVAAGFAGENRIRHTWACDSCGTAFKTEIRLFGPRSGARRGGQH